MAAPVQLSLISFHCDAFYLGKLTDIGEISTKQVEAKKIDPMLLPISGDSRAN